MGRESAGEGVRLIQGQLNFCTSEIVFVETHLETAQCREPNCVSLRNRGPVHPSLDADWSLQLAVLTSLCLDASISRYFLRRAWAGDHSH